MSTNLNYEFVLDWDEFPHSLILKFPFDFVMADIEQGVVCDINFDYEPYCPGRYDGHPDNMYPASGPDLDINSIVITINPSSTAVATEFLRPFDDKFLETARQFALDWLDINEEKLVSYLLAWAATQNDDEIDSILSSLSEEGCS